MSRNLDWAINKIIKLSKKHLNFYIEDFKNVEQNPH